MIPRTKFSLYSLIHISKEINTADTSKKLSAYFMYSMLYNRKLLISKEYDKQDLHAIYLETKTILGTKNSASLGGLLFRLCRGMQPSAAPETLFGPKGDFAEQTNSWTDERTKGFREIDICEICLCYTVTYFAFAN